MANDRNVFKVTVTAELAGELRAYATRYDISVEQLIGFYVNKGIERDGFGPDEIDDLRLLFADVVDLHGEADGICTECEAPFPCSTVLILTTERDTWNDKFRGVWGSWLKKARRR